MEKEGRQTREKPDSELKIYFSQTRDGKKTKTVVMTFTSLELKDEL